MFNLVVNFSETAFEMFGSMLSEIERREKVNLNDQRIDKALFVICSKFGYRDADKFLNEFLNWDVQKLLVY